MISEAQPIVALIDSAGTVGLLVVMVLTIGTAFQRGWVVSRREFEAACRREEQWRRLALRGLGLTERALDTRTDTPWRENQ